MDKNRVSLKKLFRRIWIPGTWESRRLLIIGALVLIITAVAANGSAEVNPAAMLRSASATPALAAPTATLIPAIATNQTETNGLIVGGVILVLIIIGGTLGVIRRKSFE